MMEDVKWLFRKCGFPILIFLFVVIVSTVCWEKLKTEKPQNVAEEVWEPPVEIENSEEVSVEETDTESSMESVYWFVTQSEECLITNEEKKELQSMVLSAAESVSEIYVDIVISDAPNYSSGISDFTSEQRKVVVEHLGSKGLYLAVRRLLRCHPWGGSGYDPVPYIISFMLLDIHSHYAAPIAGECIWNVEPAVFSPIEGNYYSVGIHPWKAGAVREEEWRLLREAAEHPAVLAIGEAGLDKLMPIKPALQMAVFEKQILLAEAMGKPLIIHCVKAFNELVELKRKFRPNVPWVVHGFRNNVNIARMLLREDIRLSIGEKYQLPVLQEIPLECLLTETDESRMPVRDIIKSIAEVRRVTAEELSMQIAENAGKIFFQR